MTQQTVRQTPSHEPHPARWRILGFLGVAQLMLILDITVVAIALPHIETDLGLSREALTWTVSAYTLTFGGLMLFGGRITDLLGAKHVLLVGLLLFTAASLTAGLAGSAAMLVGSRVAQGFGAALLSPAALSLVVAGAARVRRPAPPRRPRRDPGDVLHRVVDLRPHRLRRARMAHRANGIARPGGRHRLCAVRAVAAAVTVPP